MDIEGEQAASGETRQGLPYHQAKSTRHGGGDALNGYSLYAMVVHSGASAQSGHYYAYVRTRSSKDGVFDDDDEDVWYLMNDENVSLTSFSKMQAGLTTFERDSPYIMFYKAGDQEAVQSTGNTIGIRPGVELEQEIATDNAKFAQGTSVAPTRDRGGARGAGGFDPPGMGGGPGFVC